MTAAAPRMSSRFMGFFLSWALLPVVNPEPRLGPPLAIRPTTQAAALTTRVAIHINDHAAGYAPVHACRGGPCDARSQ